MDISNHDESKLGKRNRSLIAQADDGLDSVRLHAHGKQKENVGEGNVADDSGKHKHSKSKQANTTYLEARDLYLSFDIDMDKNGSYESRAHALQVRIAVPKAYEDGRPFAGYFLKRDDNGNLTNTNSEYVAWIDKNKQLHLDVLIDDLKLFQGALAGETVKAEFPNVVARLVDVKIPNQSPDYLTFPQEARGYPALGHLYPTAEALEAGTKVVGPYLWEP